MGKIPLDGLQGEIVKVTIPVKGTDFSMDLKVCKVKVRSVLFIEVDRTNRKNIFRKVPMKFLDSYDSVSIKFKEGTQIDKWESSWDSIDAGRISNYYVKNRFGKGIRTII